MTAHDEARALVEQVSHGAPDCEGCGDRPGYAVEKLLAAVAASLTAALDEIERLREALTHIAETGNGVPNWEIACRFRQKIAREALKGDDK